MIEQQLLRGGQVVTGIALQFKLICQADFTFPVSTAGLHGYFTPNYLGPGPDPAAAYSIQQGVADASGVPKYA